MGRSDCRGVHMSDTLPPATERKAEPTKPVKNRKIKNTAAFGANETGKPRRKNHAYAMR